MPYGQSAGALRFLLVFCVFSVVSDKLAHDNDSSALRPICEVLMLPAQVSLSKNELLLLAEEHFSGFILELSERCDESRLYSEMGQDVTAQFLDFADMLLRLHGVNSRFVDQNRRIR